jgi:hypothetical protein
MSLRGTPTKAQKNTNLKFPRLNSLRNSAQNPEIPPKAHYCPPLLNESTWNPDQSPKKHQFKIPPFKFSSQFSAKTQNSPKTKNPISWPYFWYVYVCSPSLNSTQKPNPQNSNPTSLQFPQILAFSRRPLLKGPWADLIFYRDPFIVTHIPIFFFIHNPFSHKFLKLL